MDGRETEQQLERFKEAVDRKAAAAEAASRVRSPGEVTADPISGTQRPLEEDGRTQDVFRVRDKNSGKGKKTADKWNQ